MHFYGMREAPAIPLRDRGLSGCRRLTGREQFVTAARQLAQAEFDHQDRAALISRPHARTRAGRAGDLDIRVLSVERLEPGHLVLAGRRHDVHNGPVSSHCRDRGQGDQPHFLTEAQQGPRLPASEHAAGRLACRFPEARRQRGLESAQPRAPPGDGRRRGTDAPVIADPARLAGQPAARPGRCARRSDRRGSSIVRLRARCALLERTGVPQPSQRPPR